MRIAVVGSGISGLTAGWLLSRQHEVHLFEASSRLGGHTHTHRIATHSGEWAVDSGFIVFNPQHYPLFCRLLDELGVGSQASDMSFSVRNDRSGLEYNATSLPRLFCQRRNLVRPRFHRMIREILRFYREAPALLQRDDPGPATGDYLAEHGYSDAFRDDHLVPMASALWSMPPHQVLRFPIRYMVQFFANHSMLQAGGRSPWRVVAGGSDRYIGPLTQPLSGHLHRSTPVRQVIPSELGPILRTDAGEARYDRIVLACHSDQALALIPQPTPAQQEILGAIRFQRNEAVLHTDTSVLPRRRAAWAAWNARVPAADRAACTVTYHMNILQRLAAPEQFLVSLNQGDEIAADRVIERMVYHHPVHDAAAVAAQQQIDAIDGIDGLHYCGAWWGWGFHEDGVRSAVRIARRLGIEWP